MSKNTLRKKVKELQDIFIEKLNHIAESSPSLNEFKELQDTITEKLNHIAESSPSLNEFKELQDTITEKLNQIAESSPSLNEFKELQDTITEKLDQIAESSPSLNEFMNLQNTITEKLNQIPDLGPMLANLKELQNLIKMDLIPNNLFGQIQEMASLGHPATQMKHYGTKEPIIIERGRGSYIYDIEGNRYLDGISSLGVTIHGHDNERLKKAIKDQIEQISHSTLVELENAPEIKLTKKLEEITPQGLNLVFYSDAGITTMEMALKIASQYWHSQKCTKKTKFISFVKSSPKDNIVMEESDLFEPLYPSLSFRGLYAPTPYCYRCPLSKEKDNCQEECIKSVEDIMKSSHEEIAALIIEPLAQGVEDIIITPKGYFKKIRELCTKYKILLIANEINTGFGRTGTLFACQQEEVSPDIMCIAKGLAIDYLPLSATIISEEIYHILFNEKRIDKKGLCVSICTGNSIKCVAALANIALLEEDKLIDKLQSNINFISKELEKFSNLKHVGEVSQKGYIIRITLVLDKATKETYPKQCQIGYNVFLKARNHGLIIRPVSEGIVLMPVLSMSKEELSTTLDITYQAIKTITEEMKHI